MIKNFLLSALILLTTSICFADSTIKIKYGVGIDTNKKDFVNDDFRAVDIGYFINLDKSISWAVTAGYFGDKQIDLNTGYGCLQFGASLRPLPFIYADNFFGPCYFHKTEGTGLGQISGRLQFATNLGFGWRDENTGSRLGINVKHFSNAGLSKPNTGVNLIMLSMEFGLNKITGGK